MNFDEVFGLFSKRNKPPSTVPPLTDEFRNRVIMRFKDTVIAADMNFWYQTHKRLLYLKGKVTLADERDLAKDLNMFLFTCVDEDFLSFIEAALQTEPAKWKLGREMQTALVRDINKFFDEDALRYALTDYVWHESMEKDQWGIERTTHRLIALPQVILKESQVTHATTIAPALSLLADPRLKSANEEFLSALSDYRKGDYGDCVAKCGSSFESTLKAICHVKGWPYSQNETAAPLLKTVLAKSSFDSFFEQPLMLIATMRNRLSSAHGAGTETKSVPKHVADYAVSATAAAIRLLVTECL